MVDDSSPVHRRLAGKQEPSGEISIENAEIMENCPENYDFRLKNRPFNCAMQLAFNIGAIMCLLQVAVCHWHGETVAVKGRKPVTVDAINRN